MFHQNIFVKDQKKKKSTESCPYLHTWRPCHISGRACPYCVIQPLEVPLPHQLLQSVFYTREYVARDVSTESPYQLREAPFYLLNIVLKKKSKLYVCVCVCV